MSPAEYAAHVRVHEKKERRIKERFATLAVVMNRSMGGKLEMDDLLGPEDDE